MNSKPHHTKKGFRNPFPGFKEKSFGDFLKWMLSSESRFRRENDREGCNFKIIYNDGKFLRSNRTAFTVTWVGHATLLIQMEGVNILTDPMWSERCSPVQFAGPIRYTPPGIALLNLPEIHAVIITHNHYDHLDTGTIERLGKAPEYFVPLGLGSFIRKLGIDRFHEMDWWDSFSIGDIEYICAPAQHFSSRGFFDRNRTLWCSWVVRGEKHSFYFAGDTGYFPGFREIGERYGPFDMVAVPIGAYLPGWFMGSVHLSPAEAVRAFFDLRGRCCVPVHWGTFTLADDPPYLAPLEFVREIKKRNLNAGQFWLMRHGETRIVTE